MTDYGFVVVFLLAVGAVVAIVARARKARRLPGAAEDQDLSGAGTLEGAPYRYEFAEAGRSSPATFRVEIDDAPAGLAFTVRRETGTDRTAKSIGFAREHHTGDPAFDAEFYLETEDADDAPPTFRLTADQREAIRRLFALGVTEVSRDGATMSAVWSGQDASSAIDATTVHAAVASLRTLAPTSLAARLGLAAWASGGLWSRVPRARRIPLVTVALWLAGGATAWVGYTWYLPIDAWSSGVLGLEYGLGAMVVVLGLVALALRGRSTAHRDLALLGPTLVLAVPALTVGGLWLGNVLLDRGPMATRMTPVVDKRDIGGKNARHVITIASWDGAGARHDITVSQAFYHPIQPGRTVVIFGTRPGALGYEWIATQIGIVPP